MLGVYSNVSQVNSIHKAIVMHYALKNHSDIFTDFVYFGLC